MVIIVCGGRNYADKDRLFHVLDLYAKKFPVSVLIQGKGRGADELAEAWALSRGVHCAGVAALWDKHGKAAGPRRNRAMRDLKPDAVLAFPGGAGTEDMCRAAEEVGIPVHRIPG